MLKLGIERRVEQNYQQASSVVREWLKLYTGSPSGIVAPNGRILECWQPVDVGVIRYCGDVYAEFERLDERGRSDEAMMLLDDTIQQLEAEESGDALKPAKLAILYNSIARAERNLAEQSELSLRDDSLLELDLSKLYNSAGVDSLRAGIVRGDFAHRAEYAGQCFFNAGMPDVCGAMAQFLPPPGMTLERSRMRKRPIHSDIRTLGEALVKSINGFLQ